MSVTQQGTASPQGGGGVSISQDGRFVVFTSGASDLVAGDDDGGLYDVFLRDLARGRTVHVSVGAPGVTGADGQSVTTPDVSRDGRYVAFASFAADLVPGDRNETRDVFVRDVVAGTTTLVSRGPNGASVGPVDDAPLISDDGATIVFGSFAPDLVAGDRNGTSDVFTWRRDQGVTLVSRAKDGVGSGDGDSFAPSLSADGTRVAFQSQARNLVVGASERAYSEDIFVRDLTTGTTQLVSRNRAGSAAGSAGGVAISADGRRVAYVSFAEGAIGDDMAGNDLVVYDLGTGSTWLVRSADGEPSRAFTLSGNGRRVAFTSTGNYQVHLAELPSRGPLTVQRISNTPLGVAGNSVSTAPFISRNGRMVVFASAATDLVDVKDVNLTNYDLFTWR